MGRAPCCDKANVKKGPWSPEEDAKLKAYIEKHGTGGNWIALPQKIGLKRCGKSCRLRWLNYLRPNIKHGGFSEEEENVICSLYVSIGSRWSVIAGQLPGRTDNDIKNYWNTRLKKKLMSKQRKEHSARNCGFTEEMMINNDSTNMVSYFLQETPRDHSQFYDNGSVPVGYSVPFAADQVSGAMYLSSSLENLQSREYNSLSGVDGMGEELSCNRASEMQCFECSSSVENSNWEQALAYSQIMSEYESFQPDSHFQDSGFVVPI